MFAEITAQPGAPFPGRGLHNQNELMYRYPGVIGGKTGFTDIARKTYVVAAERDGKRLVVSMMYGLVHEGGPTYATASLGEICATALPPAAAS
ncbi:D-alanyl-D-alanine carboxypeptidase DacB [Mycobacteroides abscessus subsp. abscessus]|nr:D-alanyl-D-alanine carboxypeptidase DacB [Mycobacteroides abscessus subsp. abscessus]